MKKGITMMTQSNKRSCSNTRTDIKTFESIPYDLIIEILTRLPVKSLARFRCVSKQWNSTPNSPNFEESFFTISSCQPKLLFSCLKDGKVFFFSSLQNPPLAANYDTSFPASGIGRPIRGLVCTLTQRSTKGGRSVTVPVICNPSTGRYLTLPRVKSRRQNVVTYLGYDPIGKQFKLVCMTKTYHDPVSSEHQVLTLEAGKKLSWRMINCVIAHEVVKYEVGVQDGVCINGVCYYLAKIRGGGGDGFPHIICFDIRSEEFNSIKKDQGMMELPAYSEYLNPILVNHKGKLAMLQPNYAHGKFTYKFELWVLEDSEKHEWLSYIYDMPHLWQDIINEGTRLCFVGTTNVGEIVLSPVYISDTSFLLYYNPERKTHRKVDIHGMEDFEFCKAYTILDHVENVKFMKSV